MNNIPDKELKITGRSLNNTDSHRVQVKFEEDPRCSFSMLHLASVVCHSVLVRFQSLVGTSKIRKRVQEGKPCRRGGYVGGGNNMQEVLIRNECCSSALVRVVNTTFTTHENLLVPLQTYCQEAVRYPGRKPQTRIR